MTDLPSTVVYGVLPGGGVAVLEEGDARTRAAELSAIMAAPTVGAARTVAAGFRANSPPPGLGELDVDDPFSLAEMVELSEGDWPAMPAQLMIDDLSPDLVDALVEDAGATVEASAINGDLLEIPEDSLDAVVSVLDRLGIRHVRDDDVIGVLGIESLYG